MIDREKTIKRFESRNDPSIRQTINDGSTVHPSRRSAEELFRRERKKKGEGVKGKEKKETNDRPSNGYSHTLLRHTHYQWRKMKGQDVER